MDDAHFLYYYATGANSYITIIGSRRWAPLRITISQAFNGLGTTISPVVASYAFFGGNESATGNLDSVKWTYVGVGCGKLYALILLKRGVYV